MVTLVSIEHEVGQGRGYPLVQLAAQFPCMIPAVILPQPPSGGTPFHSCRLGPGIAGLWVVAQVGQQALTKAVR